MTSRLGMGDAMRLFGYALRGGNKDALAELRALYEERADRQDTYARAGADESERKQYDDLGPSAVLLGLTPEEAHDALRRQVYRTSSGDDVRPCKGANSNVCVAEGCFGEACREVYAEKRGTFGGEAQVAVAAALGEHEWYRPEGHEELWVDSRHDCHIFHGACAICAGDLDQIAKVAVDAMRESRNQSRQES